MAQNISLPEKDIDDTKKNDKNIKSQSSSKNNLLSIITVVSIVVLSVFYLKSTQFISNDPTVSDDDLSDFVDAVCPVGETIRPASYLQDKSTIESILNSNDYREYTIKNLEGAIRCPTVTFDSNKQPSESTEEWVEFPKFHDFLATAFPQVHTYFKVEKVNQYGLLLTWEGSRPELKPMLFMAHQDVVPIDPQTLPLWNYPPFEGHHDDEYIYGRGASDCKNLIISYFQAFEKLINDGFKPQRTMVLSFGFDEEIDGMFGATELAKVLINRYGKDSFFAVLDEGGASITKIDDVPFAFAPVAEKGNLAIQIELTTPGGHSSMPPDHTNIGIMSKLVDDIEETPFDPILSKENPVLNHLQCFAKYTTRIPESLKKAIFRAGVDTVANKVVMNFLSTIKLAKSSIRTTQAVDVIHGGVKSNALPEYSQIVINHRISLESSVQATIDKILSNVKAIANRFDLGLYFYDEEIIPKTEHGTFKLTHGRILEPSKISPLDNDSFNIFRGTLKHILSDYVYPGAKEPVVAGTIMPANTDTNKYWDLTDNIYRFTYSSIVNFMDAGIHTVNEKVRIDDIVRSTAFIYEYVRNVDEFDEY